MFPKMFPAPGALGTACSAPGRRHLGETLSPAVPAARLSSARRSFAAWQKRVTAGIINQHNGFDGSKAAMYLSFVI